jgi:hypothetical protein
MNKVFLNYNTISGEIIAYFLSNLNNINGNDDVVLIFRQMLDEKFAEQNQT